MNRGRLGKYALWQFRDFAIDRGVAILIVGFLWGYVLVAPFRGVAGAHLKLGPSSPVWPLLITVASSIVSVSVLIAVNGIVSLDRKNGYYRFLFSKPVSVVAYYVQLYFVHMVGVIAAMLVLSGVLRTMVPDFSIVNFLLYTALIFVTMGGIGFFISGCDTFRLGHPGSGMAGVARAPRAVWREAWTAGKARSGASSGAQARRSRERAHHVRECAD
jgi:hypothetical protein